MYLFFIFFILFDFKQFEQKVLNIKYFISIYNYLQTSQELQAANLTYDKANSAHAAAREMVYLAEQGLARLADGSGGLTLDPAWQEMLNHATHRVNQVRRFLSFILS